ncbi:hypothetical protein, partial [Enterococcus faecium]
EVLGLAEVMNYQAVANNETDILEKIQLMHQHKKKIDGHAAGIAVGGRSGITAITTGIFFLLGLFFSPLLSVVTSQVTAPA